MQEENFEIGNSFKGEKFKFILSFPLLLLIGFEMVSTGLFKTVIKACL